MEFTLSCTPRVPAPLMHEEKDGLCLLLHPEKPIWTMVNHVGLQIVRLCDGEHTVQNIAAIIADRYVQDPNQVQADVIAYLQQLEQAGFLQVPFRGTSSSPPRSIHLYLNVTERCNLHCIHCAVTDKPAPPDAFNTVEIRRLVDELSPANGGSVAFSGGEPLLRRDALDILQYASQRVQTSLDTNATLIDEDTAAALSELDIKIQISLDGASPAVHDRIRGKGAFDRTMRAVEMLRRHGFAGGMVFSMTVMRPNIADVPSVIDLAERMEVNLRLLPVQRLGRADASWAEISPTPEDYTQLYTYFYREIRHTGRKIAVDGGLQGFILDVPEQGVWCGIGDRAAVDAEGNVYPCSLLMTPEFRLGNVKQTPLRQIMESPRLQELERFCAARKTRIEKCSHCHWRNFCQACCPASVLMEKGTMLETDDLCEFRKHLYRETFFDLAQRKVKRENLAKEQAC
jgi:radical SAM protein with 4Fe4S-binding SPASM domain